MAGGRIVRNRSEGRVIEIGRIEIMGIHDVAVEVKGDVFDPVFTDSGNGSLRVELISLGCRIRNAEPIKFRLFHIDPALHAFIADL